MVVGTIYDHINVLVDIHIDQASDNLYNPQFPSDRREL